MMTEFFNWQTLATFAGAAIATGLITQFAKDSFPKLPTQILSYFIALFILFTATFAISGLSGFPADYLIVPLNAVVVSIAANGAYSAITRNNKKK